MRIIVVLFLVSLFSLSRADDVRAHSRDERIAVDFTDEPRSSVLKRVADFYGLAIVYPDDYKDQPVTIKLKHVDWITVIDFSLAGSEYTFMHDRSTVRIILRSSDMRTISSLRHDLESEIIENERYREVLGRLAEIKEPKDREAAYLEIRELLKSKDIRGAQLLEALSNKSADQTLQRTPGSESFPSTGSAPRRL